jgi:hypothetical protein
MKDQYAHNLIEVLTEILKTLNRLERHSRPAKLAKAIELLTLIDGRWVEVKNMILKSGEKAILKLRILDAGGNPARVDGDKVSWSLSDPAIGDLKVAEDFMSAEFYQNGAVGKTMVQCKADADLGEGVKELVAEMELETLSGEAVVMELAAEVAPL